MQMTMQFLSVRKLGLNCSCFI